MPGVRIRRFRADDVNALYEAVRESIADVSPWLLWCRPGYSRTEAAEWIAARPAEFDDGSQYAFAVVDDEDAFLGGCGLNDVNDTHRMANLGYWVRTSHAGRGVAVAAVRLLAEFAFSQTDLVRLEILVAAGNTRSQRVAEKAGAVREGLLHDRLVIRGQAQDALVYALLRSRSTK